MNTAHASAEVLSAYLDDELTGNEKDRLECHLEACSGCRADLDGLRRVVRRLRHLERAAPPPLLASQVARRVALEERPRGLIDRVEGSLKHLHWESPILVTFAMVAALAAILYLFVEGVDLRQRRSVPVLVAWPELREEAPPERREVAGRIFELEGEVWVEEGVGPEIPEAVLTAQEAGGLELLERRPELEGFVEEGFAVRFEDSGRVVEVVPGELP